MIINYIIYIVLLDLCIVYFFQNLFFSVINLINNYEARGVEISYKCLLALKIMLPILGVQPSTLLILKVILYLLPLSIFKYDSDLPLLYFYNNGDIHFMVAFSKSIIKI